MMRTTLSSFIPKPSSVWLFLFLPALCYYTGTRLRSLGLFRSSTYGRPVTSQVSWLIPSSAIASNTCHTDGGNKNNKFLFLQQDCQTLTYPIYIIQEDFDLVVATTWREDDELGRGYLLLSTASGRGNIFRWEAGGGPIAIGRTLSLRDSGCRSNLYRNCTIHPNDDDNVDDVTTTNNNNDINQLGSGGIAVDTSHDPPRLIVAEFGEGRISRLEENGARTPLVIQVPTTTESSSSGSNHSSVGDVQRLNHPTKLLMTPYGDLMILDSATIGGNQMDILWRLPNAADVPSLPSLSASRVAHSWNRVNHTTPHMFFQSNAIGGMVLDSTGQRVYVTTRQGASVMVVSLPLLDEVDEEEDEPMDEQIQSIQQDEKDEDDDDGKGSETIITESDRITTQRGLKQQSQIFFDYSEFANDPGAIEIDNNGNLYLVVDDGILLVVTHTSSPPTKIMVKISFSIDPLSDKIVDLTLGSDKFLYIATETKLARVRMPNHPLKVQKHLLMKA